MATVKRRFYYYKTGPTDISFKMRLEAVEALELGVRASMTHLGRQVMFQVDQQGGFVCGWVTLLRDDQVPSIGERDSAIGRPMQLAPNQGVLEQSHFIFMPSTRTLVFEYNHFGPRVSLLFETINQLYREHIDNDAEDVTYCYIPRGDALDRLRRGKSVIGFDLSYEPSAEITPSSQASSLSNLFQQANQIGEPQSVELVIKASKKSRLMAPVNFIRDVVNPNGDLEVFKKLKVKIENPLGAVETIDLLQDRTVSEISVIRLDQHRQLDTNNVYEKVIVELNRKYSSETQTAR